MITHFEEIVSEILNTNKDLSSFVFVLPGKRAGIFLKKEILSQNSKTQFSPQILSIEEFIETIADLKIASSIELLFELYETYFNCRSIKEKETFEAFSAWASVLLDDFSEMDRNLVDSKRFFNYLNDIKKMEHWSVNQKQTEFVINYLSFWNSISELYANFTKAIRQKGQAYQGLVYREATKNIAHYIEAKKHNPHVFIGFNALNKAEEIIIKELLEAGNTQVYWDADQYFMDKPYHSASTFLRTIKSQWKHYQSNTFKNISAYYEQPKNISIIGCSKSIGQAKYVAEILQHIPENQLEHTALVLADESLLLPVLNALPENIKTANITMGLPLKALPATSFYENLFKLHQDGLHVYYYKNILQLINHPLGRLLLPESSTVIQKLITSQNFIQVSYEVIKRCTVANELHIIDYLFSPKGQQVSTLIANAKSTLLVLKEKTNDPVLVETLFKLYEVWNKLETLNAAYNHVKTTKTLYRLFSEVASVTSVDFKGEPYKGLQIMGLLETRSLDFENIILVSVNEGIIPAGKSNRSFITYDLKKEYKLPTHTEKDAVYAYHFYRLLQRASTIHLLYNNHTTGLQAGEKSRFLLQLAYESPESHTISEKIVAPKITISEKQLTQIKKTPEVIKKLKLLALYGFSPSALTTYIRNPIDFYNRYILGIKDVEDIEETVAANTLGTIVHDTLQHLYEPFVNTVLTESILSEMTKKADETVAGEFSKTYKEGNIKSGKNRIIFEVSKRYVHNFLKQELQRVKEGNEITVVQIENQLEAILEIPELGFDVKIRGKVDRIDVYNNAARVIDYKTGKTTQSDLNLIDWDELITDYKHSKKIQVLAYAVMASSHIDLKDTQAGIISFKNLGAGFMPFTKKETSRGHGDTLISEQILSGFKVQLKKLIVEICNPDVPFIEKEIPKNDY